MIFKPAHKIALIFVALFLLVTGVVLFGSLYYKNTLPIISEIPFIPVQTETLVEQEAAKTNLQLIPTNTERTEYKIVISDITNSISGVVFQLQSAANGAQITSTSIETDPSLEALGWSTAINTSTETDSNQQLSFSMILSSPGTEINVQSLDIGTITFNQAPNSNDLTINAEESYVTYKDDTLSYLNLLLETANIED